MKVTFWGVRGSIPAPGPDTVRVGGNTPCVEIRTADGDLIILDAGTGIRRLGLQLESEFPDRLIGHILLSHTHWDHIQGLPYFLPTFRRGNRFVILGEKRVDERLEHVLEGQYVDTYLPFSLWETGADILVKEVMDGETVVIGEHTLVTACHQDHPGGVFAYRIRWRHITVVYATDVRHPPGRLDEDLLELAQGADLLIHDAHFTPEEILEHPHFGHSSWLQALHVAQAAQVKRLGLFHHKPTASDDDLEAIEQEAKALFPEVFLCREGKSIDLLQEQAETSS